MLLSSELSTVSSYLGILSKKILVYHPPDGKPVHKIDLKIYCLGHCVI